MSLSSSQTRCCRYIGIDNVVMSRTFFVIVIVVVINMTIHDSQAACASEAVKACQAQSALTRAPLS